MKARRWEMVLNFFLCLGAAFLVFDALAQGPKIAEISGPGESLWHFLSRLPMSFEAQIFYGGTIFGAFGMFANYSVKWMRNDIAGGLFKYLFQNNLKGTLLSFSTTVGIVITAITTGVFETANGDFVGWFNVMWISLTNGFMWDAALNSGKRATWTPEERSTKNGGANGPTS